MDNAEVCRDVYGEEVDILQYVKVVWKNWKLIIAIVGIIVVGTAIWSLLMTKIYEAKTVIIPAGVLGKDQGAAASFLAQQFGLAPPTSPASAEILNLLKSNIIKEKMIKRNNLLPLFFKPKDLRDKSEDEQIWIGIRHLRNITTINFLPKDNIIELSVRYKDPQISADLVAYYLLELNDHMSSEAKRVASKNKEYLESQVDKTPDPFIRAKIYALIAQQIETSTMAEVKENFAFKTLDPPKAPDQRVSPKRTLMVVISFVISFVLAIVIVLVKDNLRRKAG